MTSRKIPKGGINWAVVGSVGAFVVGGILGFATNYWVSYRSDFRSSLEARLTAFVELNTEVSDDLRIFFQTAEGQRSSSESDVEALRKSLYDSVTEAQTLAAQIGDSIELLTSYQKASVDLQVASQAVTGPLDAAPLMEAASDYLVAEQKLREAALDSYGSVF